MNQFILAVITLVFTTALGALSTAALADTPYSDYVDDDGNISFPEGFRTSMVHLGSWYVPEGAASGFHDVYTERSSVEAYRQTGQFPDGATLVKELRASRSADYTTGAAVKHSTASIKQWFVMVKDSKGRYANNPLWGDGWGWALYQPGKTDTNLARDYKTDCLGCHVPAKAKDWIYTEAYPVLTEE